MDVNTKSFLYRDNIDQAGFRFLLFFILILGGVYGLFFFDLSSMSTTESDYTKKVFWSFIIIGAIFFLFSLTFFLKVFIIKNTKIILKDGNLYMPPFLFSKLGREIKIKSITDLKLEKIGDNQRLTFGSVDSLLRFQLESLSFINHDFEIFLNKLRELNLNIEK
jgi:hypothetical protein